MEKQLLIDASNEAIRKQREKISEKKNETNVVRIPFDEKNYLNVKLAPGETSKTLTVRLLPVSASNPNVFLNIKTHSLKVHKDISKSGFKQYICLNDEQISDEYGERGCPLCQKSAELFAQLKGISNEEEYKALLRQAYFYKAKDTFIVRVIDRERESEGVKFWRFNHHSDGSGVYDKIMSIYDRRMKESIEDTNEEYSIFSLVNGRDLIITITSSPKLSKNEINIVDKGRPTPLSNDVGQANRWISDSKTWRDIYGIKNYDYLKVIADGDVPVFDKEKHLFVARTEITETPISSIVSQGTSTYEAQTDVGSMNSIEDLPF